MNPVVVSRDKLWKERNPFLGVILFKVPLNSRSDGSDRPLHTRCLYYRLGRIVVDTGLLEKPLNLSREERTLLVPVNPPDSDRTSKESFESFNDSWRLSICQRYTLKQLGIGIIGKKDIKILILKLLHVHDIDLNNFSRKGGTNPISREPFAIRSVQRISRLGSKEILTILECYILVAMTMGTFKESFGSTESSRISSLVVETT